MENPKRHMIYEPIDKTKAWEYFDGAIQGTTTISGEGGIIFFNVTRSISFVGKEALYF
jgi:hypothetical protein